MWTQVAARGELVQRLEAAVRSLPVSAGAAEGDFGHATKGHGVCVRVADPGAAASQHDGRETNEIVLALARSLALQRPHTCGGVAKSEDAQRVAQDPVKGRRRSRSRGSGQTRKRLAREAAATPLAGCRGGGRGGAEAASRLGDPRWLPSLQGGALFSSFLRFLSKPYSTAARIGSSANPSPLVFTGALLGAYAWGCCRVWSLRVCRVYPRQLGLGGLLRTRDRRRASAIGTSASDTEQPTKPATGEAVFRRPRAATTRRTRGGSPWPAPQPADPGSCPTICKGCHFCATCQQCPCQRRQSCH